MAWFINLQSSKSGNGEIDSGVFGMSDLNIPTNNPGLIIQYNNKTRLKFGKFIIIGKS